MGFDGNFFLPYCLAVVSDTTGRAVVDDAHARAVPNAT